MNFEFVSKRLKEICESNHPTLTLADYSQLLLASNVIMKLHHLKQTVIHSTSRDVDADTQQDVDSTAEEMLSILGLDQSS